MRDHQRYHFECRCVACAEAWPTLSDNAIESRVAGLRAEAYRAAGPVDNRKVKRFSRLADKALRPTKVGLTLQTRVQLQHQLPLTKTITESLFFSKAITFIPFLFLC